MLARSGSNRLRFSLRKFGRTFGNEPATVFQREWTAQSRRQ